MRPIDASAHAGLHMQRPSLMRLHHHAMDVSGDAQLKQVNLQSGATVLELEIVSGGGDAVGATSFKVSELYVFAQDSMLGGLEVYVTGSVTSPPPGTKGTFVPIDTRNVISSTQPCIAYCNCKSQRKELHDLSIFLGNRQTETLRC